MAYRIGVWDLCGCRYVLCGGLWNMLHVLNGVFGIEGKNGSEGEWWEGGWVWCTLGVSIIL